MTYQRRKQDVRSSCSQNLMPSGSGEQRQDSREKQRAHKQDADTDAGGVGVEDAVFVFDKVIQEIDGHDQ